jgi:hypothetical protein
VQRTALLPRQLESKTQKETEEMNGKRKDLFMVLTLVAILAVVACGSAATTAPAQTTQTQTTTGGVTAVQATPSASNIPNTTAPVAATPGPAKASPSDANFIKDFEPWYPSEYFLKSHPGRLILFKEGVLKFSGLQIFIPEEDWEQVDPPSREVREIVYQGDAGAYKVTTNDGLYFFSEARNKFILSDVPSKIFRVDEKGRLYEVFWDKSYKTSPINDAAWFAAREKDRLAEVAEQSNKVQSTLSLETVMERFGPWKQIDGKGNAHAPLHFPILLKNDGTMWLSQTRKLPDQGEITQVLPPEIVSITVGPNWSDGRFDRTSILITSSIGQEYVVMPSREFIMELNPGVIYSTNRIDTINVTKLK